MTGNLQKRGNRFFFRRRVPADLQSHFGKTTLLASLDTSDYDTAKVRAAVMTAQTNAEFAALRGEKPDAWKPTRLSLPGSYADTIQHADEWAQEYAANRDHHEALDNARREERASTNRLLSAAGMLTVEQLAIREFIATEPVTGRREVIRMDAPTHLKNLRHVVPSWTTRQRSTPNAIGRMNKALDLFEAAVGVISLPDLTKAHGATFVRYLLEDQRGFSAKTAHNHASNITALMNVAVRDDLIDRNPFDLAFDKNADAQNRGPWTDAELQRMFSSALFSGAMGAVPEWQGVKPADGRALLLILQHTGARVGEIAQLRRGDFQNRDGITYISITPDAGTLKTAESKRLVPLAGHLLVDTWFSTWLAGIMDGKRPDVPALPSMAGRSRGPADTAVQWFLAFRKDAKLPLGRLEGSHKFRHWIRSALADKGVGDATADSITGHAGQGSSGRIVYTAAASLPVMLEALNRINYPKVSGG
jgi:integrase